MIISFLKFGYHKLQYLYHLFLLYFPGSLPLKIVYLRRTRKGEKLYFSFARKYGDKYTINLCPYKGTGDVYLAGAYFSKSSLKTGKDVFVVINKSNQNILMLFGLEKIEVIKEKEMDALVRFAVFVGLENAGINMLHPDPPKLHEVHIGIIDYLRNINGLNFADIIGSGAFNLKESKNFAKPKFESCEAETEKLFKEKNLVPGKTILIAPYSYTLPNLPQWFWIKLVTELKKLGFCVCTNLGSKKEQIIEGTQGVFLPYSQIDLFLRRAGFFIGIRSGFCEVISSIPCKKIILYQPYFFWGDGENIDYFSLNKMGLCDNAVELQHKGIDFYSLIDEIKNSITAIR